jgi:hypothetical protein
MLMMLLEIDILMKVFMDSLMNKFQLKTNGREVLKHQLDQQSTDGQIVLQKRHLRILLLTNTLTKRFTKWPLQWSTKTTLSTDQPRPHQLKPLPDGPTALQNNPPRTLLQTTTSTRRCTKWQLHMSTTMISLKDAPKLQRRPTLLDGHTLSMPSRMMSTMLMVDNLTLQPLLELPTGHTHNIPNQEIQTLMLMVEEILLQHLLRLTTGHIHNIPNQEIQTLTLMVEELLLQHPLRLITGHIHNIHKMLN